VIEFRQIDDANAALAHSPMVRALEKTFTYIAEHDGIGLTPSKAFKRVFVHWAAREGSTWSSTASTPNGRPAKLI